MHTYSPSAGPDELTLVLTDAAHLFVAPPAQPLSPSAPEALGVAGVDYLLGRLRTDPAAQRARTLTLIVPPDKASGVDATRLALALHRQAEFRLDEQRRELRHTYRHGLKVAGIAVVLLAACIAVSSLFASDLTAGMRPLIRKTFEYGFEIVGWVMLWNPVDVLVFSPLAIRAQIRALNTLANVQLVVRPSALPPV
jgi:hypothetical protein